MKRILIIATGGTIAGTGSAGDTTQYTCGELDVSTLLKVIPNVHKFAKVDGIQLMSVPSDDITTEDICKIAKTINEYSKKNEYDGFVVTHGTDTLEETAYFLNLILKTNKPVVVTGAMRPSTATSADGPQNLYQSIMVASREESLGQGVLVVFADTIYSAREVTKVSTQAINGFGGRDFGALGYIHDDYIEYVRTSLKKHTIDSEFDLSDNYEEIPVLYFHVDASPKLLEFALNEYKAIIIAGGGNGCMSNLWEEVLRKEENAEKIVVLTSRVSNGAVIKHHTSPKNCISGGTINPQKARILLQVAMTKSGNHKTIEQMFEIY